MEAGDTKLQKMKAVLESLRKESEEKEEEKKRIQEEGKKEELRLRTKEETVVKAMKELEIEKERWEKEAKELESEMETFKIASSSDDALCEMRRKEGGDKEETRGDGGRDAEHPGEERTVKVERCDSPR